MSFAENYSNAELREVIDRDTEEVGATHPTVTISVAFSVALCPTTKCTSKC